MIFKFERFHNWHDTLLKKKPPLRIKEKMIKNNHEVLFLP